MSDRERPDVAAFRELSLLIRVLGDEMAAWRRRAHEAEQRVKEMEGAPAAPAAPNAERRSTATAGAGDLAKENADLRARLEAASERTRQLMEKVHFLRQQHGAGAEK